MLKVNKILPIQEIQELVAEVDNNDMRAVTTLRNKMENREVAANPVLRECLILAERECINPETVYLMAGICLQYGAQICQDSLCLTTDRNILINLQIMSNVQTYKGICPLNKQMRNWLASLLNRNDGWEGGINPIPKIFMQDLKGNICRSVTSGSSKFYRGMVDYVKVVSCDLKTFVLQEIIIAALSCMDMAPVMYAIKEGGAPIKRFAEDIISKAEPKDECSRQGLVNIAKIVSTISVCQ